MSDNEPTDDQLYVMFLYGLAVLRELRRAPKTPTLGLSIFAVYHGLGLLTQAQLVEVTKNYRLMGLMIERGTNVVAQPSPQLISELVQRSDKPLIIITEPDDRLIYARLFAPQGHKFILTDLGFAWVQQLPEQPVSPVDFAEAWGVFTQRNRGMQAHLRARREDLS